MTFILCFNIKLYDLVVYATITSKQICLFKFLITLIFREVKILEKKSIIKLLLCIFLKKCCFFVSSGLA